MRIVGLDLETTGLKYEKGDKIIEVCLSGYDLVGTDLRHVETYTQRVNPLRTISVEAQRVHGITLEDLRTMPVWADIAPNIKRMLDEADVVVIHNEAFDRVFIEGEQRAAGHALETMLTFCTMDKGRWATYDGKLPKLGELCWTLDIDYDPSVAHAADYDVAKMMECFIKGLKLGLFKLELKGE